MEHGRWELQPKGKAAIVRDEAELGSEEGHSSLAARTLLASASQ